MTEKRFIYCFEGIEDKWETVDEYKYTPCTKDGFQDLCDMLNDLNDENNQLKKELEELNNLKNLCGDYNIKLTDIYDIVEETIEYYTKKIEEELR